MIEDYLDSISISVEEFATETEGQWLFGYADALMAAGSEACIVVISRNYKVIQRFTNPDTGLVTIVLPSSISYKLLSRLPGNTTANIARYTALPGRALAKALQEEKCTHIIMQEYTDPRFDMLIPVAKRLGLPVAATFQGGQYEPFNLIVRRIRHNAIHAADGLIIASTDEIRRVQNLYGFDLTIKQIFNPVSPNMWFPENREACRKSLGLKQEARIVICHCRIDFWHKGIDVLLKAWRNILSEYPSKNLRLHLIGDGPDANKLREEIKRDPIEGLRWVDSFTQDRALMRRELSAADLHVQASRHEGFSVAPLEAMACGLPTILSRAPGAADLLENEEKSGGLLVPVGAPEALASSIASLLLDDERRITMGEAAKRHVLNVASTESVGKQLVDFLSQMKV